MTLAYLISQYPARSHTFIRREIAELRRRGATIHVFAIRKPPADALLSDQDRQDHLETTSILPVSITTLLVRHLRAFLKRPGRYLTTLSAALSHRLPGLRNLLWAVFQFAEAIWLGLELQRRGISHLHVHFANAGANVGYLAHRYSDIGWSMTLHGASDFEYPAGPLLGRKIESCSFANCISYYGRAQALRTVSPEHWRKIFVSRCGIEPDGLPQKPLKLPGSMLQVVCVGRLSTEKGQLGLVEAFAIVATQTPEVRLVIVGDGPDRRHVEMAIRNRRLEDKVILTGAVAEQEALARIAAADLFALPSLMEGIPLVLMEAMALEVPVVAPRLTGIPELVEHDVNGLLYSPGNWNEMAEQISSLLANPGLRDRLARQGRQKVLHEFTIAKGVEPLWRELSAIALAQEGVDATKLGTLPTAPQQPDGPLSSQ